MAVDSMGYGTLGGGSHHGRRRRCLLYAEESALTMIEKRITAKKGQIER